MAEEKHPVAGSGHPVRTREEVERDLRTQVKKTPALVATSLFEDPNFQRIMNNWMIGTHIRWGLSLAGFFLGLNALIGWINPPIWLTALTLTPLGGGYTVYQWLKYRRGRAKNANPF